MAEVRQYDREGFLKELGAQMKSRFPELRVTFHPTSHPSLRVNENRTSLHPSRSGHASRRPLVIP
jgi:hypothetical protein